MIDYDNMDYKFKKRLLDFLEIITVFVLKYTKPIIFHVFIISHLFTHSDQTVRLLKLLRKFLVYFFL